MHYKYTNFSLLDPLKQYKFLPTTKPLLLCFAKKETLAHDFKSTNATNKIFQIKNHSYSWKKLTVADMLSRTFTKEQLQIHQLRHKQLPPRIDFSIKKDNQLEPVHYLVKHEEIKYNQKMIAT